MTREDIKERVKGLSSVMILETIRKMIDEGELTEDELFSLYGTRYSDLIIHPVKD